MKKRLLVLSIATAILAVSARLVREILVARGLRSRFPDVPQITTQALADWVASGRPVVLLDVRTEAEFAVSHLPNALRVDPEAPDLRALHALTPDVLIVAYCSVGYRSSKLIRRLRAAGRTNTSNLQGSIFRWANEGRPLESDGRPVRRVHPYDAVWGLLLRRSLRADVAALHN